MIKNKKSPNPIDINVGKRIRFRRTILGMSQEKLGDSLGITFQQVQKYEKGTNRVGASRLQSIAKALDIPISFFFDVAPAINSESSSEENSVIDFLSSSEGLQLNRYFVRIQDVRARQKIIELVKSIVSIEKNKSIVIEKDEMEC
ncbi:helix-turn-helix domain-containing protein [Candidatus Liberibacter americanus]|uniref:Transcriptional regulator n=1 Tax=Candidatus Liberibacter americanus str. Sao Paulo TaxID=1261131 RepID=U6B6D8_9HYPH|nr:helix-turn-helix transcriptional regulator [Candidatus Liberibacter americanus]AHA27436.1 transcriptional regulator [Candidatus Liberibacter americanus str. Sao Paulo]EMS36709.1 transcriptional regulator protein [Candidatus Liberibacter americanus PW_SP]